MKRSVKPEFLKYLVLGAGGLGLLLRTLLYHTGIDEKGLLISGHWAAVLLWVLTFATAAALLLLTRSIQGPESYQDAHPSSAPAALGTLALTVGLAMTTVSEFAEFSGTIRLLVWVLGLCAAVSMGHICYCRMIGRKPFFLCHGIVCIYFALRMVSRYQLWSSDPQLQDYVFYLGAYVALMLHAYHQAAFDADMGSHRGIWATGLAAVYLCGLSLHGPADTVLLLTAGVWAFTNTTSLTARPRRQRPKLNLEEE